MPVISLPKVTLSAVATWSLFALAILIHFAYSDDFVFSASEPRWIILNISSIIIPLFILIDSYINGRGIEGIELSSPHFILIVFSSWSLISIIWSIDAVTLVDQYLNHLSWVLLVFSFSYLASRIELDKLILPLCVSTTLVSLVGLLQCYGLDGGFYYQYSAPGATFVNKNMATPVVTMVLPLIVYQVVARKSEKQAMILSCCMAISLGYLTLAMTRSSWIGLLMSLCLATAFVFNISSLKNNFFKFIKPKRVALFFAAIIVASLLVVIHQTGDFPKTEKGWDLGVEFLAVLIGIPLLMLVFGLFMKSIRAFFVSRVARSRHLSVAIFIICILAIVIIDWMFDLTGIWGGDFLSRVNAFASKSNSISQRVAIWLNTLLIVKGNLLLGVGLDGFDAIYPYYHNSVADHKGYIGGMWLGGVHNEPLQLLAELGLIGFVIFAVFVMRLVKCAYHKIESMTDNYLYLALAIGLAGGAVDSLFNSVYHHPTSLFVTAVMVGILISSAGRGTEDYSVDVENIVNKPSRKIVLLSGILILLSSLVFNAFFSFNRYQAMKDHKETIRLANEGNLAKASVFARNAADRWPHSKIVNHNASYILFNYYQSKGTASTWRLAEHYNNKALMSLPYNYNLNLGRILLLFDSGDRNKIVMARDLLPVLFRLAPEGEIAKVNRLQFDIKQRLNLLGG